MAIQVKPKFMVAFHINKSRQFDFSTKVRTQVSTLTMCKPFYRFNLSPSPKLAALNTPSLNPHTDPPPTHPTIPARIGIAILRRGVPKTPPGLLLSIVKRQESYSSASILVPRYLSPNTGDFVSEDQLAYGATEPDDRTLWDAIQRETYKTIALSLEKVLGEFDCARHITMVDGKRVEHITMNFVVLARDGEMNVNLFPGDRMEWKWVSKDQIASLEVDLAMKDVLNRAFASAAKHPCGWV